MTNFETNLVVADRVARKARAVTLSVSGAENVHLVDQARAHPGTDVAEVHYFGNNRERWAIPSVVLGILERSPNDPKRHTRRFKVTLLKNQGESQGELFKTDFSRRWA